MKDLDRIDRSILQALAADARLSLTNLAERVHLSRTAVMARVRRLEAAGVIQGYHAAINLTTASRQVSAILLMHFSTRPCAPVIQFLRTQPEVRQVWSVSGPHDAIAEVTVESPAALSALADRLSASAYSLKVDTRLILSA
jgi:DNA-binding Lrp family transcriptional regulator